MTAIYRARLILAGSIAALVLAADFAVSPAIAGVVPSSNSRYAVEFRARAGGVFGHTYVVYGAVDGRGRLEHPRYVGIYPSGIISDTALVGVLATPSFISVKPRDLRRRPEMVYRREISARTYASLEREVLELRRSRPVWHLIFYNCNSFAGEVAQSMGLRVPSTLALPKEFVRELYVLNRGNRPTQAYAAAMPARIPAPGPSDLLFWRVVRDEP